MMTKKLPNYNYRLYPSMSNEIISLDYNSIIYSTPKKVRDVDIWSELETSVKIEVAILKTKKAIRNAKKLHSL